MKKGLDKAGILKLCKEIEGKEGEGAVYSLGSKKANLDIPRLSTGIEDLDEITGGGFPCGRIVEIFGAESSGKTSLGYHMTGRQEMALDIPIEGCVDCDTEFFSQNGWKKISEYKKGDKVLQYNTDGTACLVEPIKYHVYDAETLWHINSKTCDMCLSNHHNVVFVDDNMILRKLPLVKLLESYENCKWYIPKTFINHVDGFNFDNYGKRSYIKYWNVEPYKTKDGKMYCFTMPSEMWVMRRNDRIIVTGNTFDAKRAKVFGNRKNQLLVYRAKWGEQAFNRSIKMAELGMPLIVIDSVPSMQPREDIEKIKKAVDKDAEIETRIGGIARLMDKYLPTLEEVIEQTGTCVIFINQIRDKMNAMAFGETIQTPGGHKLKHACSLRIQVARRAWIEIPNKNPKITSINEKVGLITKFKVVKSKVCNPMGECEVPMFFDRGYVSFDDLKPIRKELMKQRAEQFGKRYREEDE